MLKAFFDDSGTSPVNRVAAVAGYIANAYHWERFNKQWTSLLREFRVHIMRRSDLESLKGQYETWNKDRQIDFIERAHRIIKKNTSVGIGTSVIKEHFETILPKDLKDTLGGVYGWCAHECLMKVEHWCDAKKYTGKVFYIFEAGTKGHGQIDAAMRLFFNMPEYKKRFRIQGWTFHDKTLIPLQAADVLAYEVFKAGENQVLHKGRMRHRISARDLLEGSDIRYVNKLTPWSESHLRRWLEVWSKNHPDLATQALSNHTS